uniref:synaptopodin n=1 Tax=Euleptes europaea TaxID=460621 RepID=UPI002542307C|nr:synaptopodin [Euleptes europaea]
MIKATLLQPCLQPQSNYTGPGKINQNPHSGKKPSCGEGYGCLGRQQGKEKESNPVGRRSDTRDQETKESTRENFLQEPCRINGELLPLKTDGSRLVPSNEHPVTRDSLRPTSGLLRSEPSNRSDQSQEWKVVKVKRVLISPVGEPRKANISRSASLSEKELKEAKARSQRIAAQLTTPPNSNSKGVLLFHRRKQRVNAFTLENTKGSREQAASEVCPKAIHHIIPSHGKELHLKETLRDNRELKGFSCIKDSGLWAQKGSMEKHEESLAMGAPQRNKVKNEESVSATDTALSSEEILAEDFQQIPLSVYLKENTQTASTNGVHEPTTNELEKMPVIEHMPVIDNVENIPPIADEELHRPGTDRENNSSTPEKEQYTLQTDRENNVIDKKPYLPLISSENNNSALDKELYIPVIDRENNVLDEALSETIFDRKENGEILNKERDMAVIENEKNLPTTDTEKSILITDSQPKDTPTHNNKQYCEVRLTLSKPMPVKNRTARPFGTQSLVTTHTPGEESPVVELPPPPTYAETFSSPPPVTRVRSPPAYSALYPGEGQKASVPQVVNYEDSRPGPPSEGDQAPLPTKSGLLEESIGRRAAKKSMFTFVEKPKVAPNPDLLNLVQRADNRKKQGGRTVPEDEPFALGAEASNFLPENTLDGPAQATADNAPEWSSCLRSPRIQPKPKIKSNQNLTEARGKGAELFARRQTRMQKYIIESSSHADVVRSPSPTISLPPSWKYASETHLSPMAFQPLPKSPVRSPRAPPPVPLYNSSMTESEISKKELEISKQQPYQLQSSLFILSPAKDPMRSLPRAAPPPKPVVPEPSYMRQASCPTSPLPPSPVLYLPVQSSPSRPLPGHFAPSPGTVFAPQNITTAGAPTDTSVEYSSRILSPRAKGIYQAPRPSYSTKDAGIEPQERRVSLPASPTWIPQLARQPNSLDGWMSPAQTPEPEEGHMEAFQAAIAMTPPPMSPSWSERSLSPFRQETDPKSSRQMQVMLARNIINAARRKSSSPKATGIDSFRPFTPPASSANVSYSGGSPKNPSAYTSSPLQSPKPTRMEGYTHVSLPVTSAAPPQVRASSNNSPRLMGSHSPIYKSPLQSPKAVRMNGNKYFTLPASSGASVFNSASSNGPRTMGNHSMTYRDPAPSPKPSIMDTHRIFTPPASATRKSSCTSPKNLDNCSPTIKSPLPSPMMGAHYPVKRYTTSSPTNSDVSIDSEDSGIKSPSIRSFNICPRGWNGSLRLKRGSLPAEAPCTS